MKQIILLNLTLMVFSLSCKFQSINKFEISKDLYNSFPDTFDITQKVFNYYYDLGFTNKQLRKLNNPQKALCYYFICDGLIGNGGFISLLQETNGEFNKGFLQALKLVGDNDGRIILVEISSNYERFKKYFDDQEIPPQLDEESDKYDKILDDRISLLEEQWFNKSKEREFKFNSYFKKNKDELIKIK